MRFICAIALGVLIFGILFGLSLKISQQKLKWSEENKELSSTQITLIQIGDGVLYYWYFWLPLILLLSLVSAMFMSESEDKEKDVLRQE
jgi:hypothetical protein